VGAALLIAAVLTFVMLALLALPASAAPSTITFSLSGTHPFGENFHEGTFTAPSPLCASGSWRGDGQGTRTFTCADGSGTFRASFDGELEHAQGTTGPWKIFAGTGALASLRGVGTVTVDSSKPTDGSPGAPEWTFSETWRGIADLDASPPTIRVGRATAVRVTTPKGWVMVRLAFTSTDNVTGNAVAYTVSSWNVDGYWVARRSGSTTAGAVAVAFTVKPQAKARSVKVQIAAQDPLGNERRLTRAVKLPLS
jgi:hypothetical protein